MSTNACIRELWSYAEEVPMAQHPWFPEADTKRYRFALQGGAYGAHRIRTLDHLKVSVLRACASC